MASLISGNITLRYNERSEGGVTGGIVLAAPTRLRETVDSSITTTTIPTTVTTTPNMDTNGDSNMDTANGGSTATGVGAMASVVASAASLTLVKVERPDHLAGTSTSPATVAAVSTGPISTGSGLFATISNKTARSDDWLATNSPGSPQNSLQSQHVIYTASQQQLSEQQQPPIAHSSPLAHQQQQVSNNGYASPMSTSSYDPYSPNGKIGEYFLSQ